MHLTYRVDWESQTVRMSLVGGRQTIRFAVPDYAAKYAGHPVDTADLIERDGGWWLHVVVTVPAPEVEPTDAVIGVDLGINRPAVTSNNNRRSRDLFVCRTCGYMLHADLNGARNIAAKYRAGGGMPPAGGLPVNQPIVSTSDSFGREEQAAGL